MKPYENTIKWDYSDCHYLCLGDGTKIFFDHSQDCCEDVYADLEQLRDTGFESDRSLRFGQLQFQMIKGYGLRLNGYGIPCYNIQNGYYSSDIKIRIEYSFDAGEFGHEEIG